ncbi:MAG: restriction endonuclease [Bacteroidetes bacterium GWE2_29_8]|nr:MAG: restriction endonuclease [Bacteroidetes bacterium GWE2_29_8]
MNNIENIPDYAAIMLPLLKITVDGEEHLKRDAVEAIANHFGLSAELRNKLLPSGQQPIIANRVGWAITYLKKAGLLESPRRSCFKITERGKEVLRENPLEIDNKFLERFPEFTEFKNTKKTSNNEFNNEDQEQISKTPEEAIEFGYQSIRKNLAEEVLNQVKQCSPKFFEQLVVKLLLTMGYGGSLQDAGSIVGQVGDGGIDGVIKEDKLGLDAIYLQAKRWEGTVGAKEIRDFVGSLVGHKANKGVFITTSSFTKDAKNYVTTIQHKVVLLDGDALAQLMIDYNVGVSNVISYEIKKVDLDYFVEEF